MGARLEAEMDALRQLLNSTCNYHKQAARASNACPEWRHCPKPSRYPVNNGTPSRSLFVPLAHSPLTPPSFAFELHRRARTTSSYVQYNNQICLTWVANFNLNVKNYFVRLKTSMEFRISRRVPLLLCWPLALACRLLSRALPPCSTPAGRPPRATGAGRTTR